MLRRFLRVASASTQTRIRAPRYASDAVATILRIPGIKASRSRAFETRTCTTNRGEVSPVTPTGTRTSYSRPGAQTARTRARGLRFSSEMRGCALAERFPGLARLEEASTIPVASITDISTMEFIPETLDSSSPPSFVSLSIRDNQSCLWA